MIGFITSTMSRSLTGARRCVRVSVDRYSFTAVDFHHLLLAGLPALTKTLPAAAPQDRQRSLNLCRIAGPS
jgi:hypothetical protein